MSVVTDRLELAAGTSAGNAVAAFLLRAQRHVRLTTVLSVLVICGCFAAATALQMRRDYAHAVRLAELYTAAQAQVLATQTGEMLDRLAALGAAYSSVADAAGAAYVIQAAEDGRVLNIATADRTGQFIGALKGDVGVAGGLPSAALNRLQLGRSVVPYENRAIGSSPVTLIFRGEGERYVVMPLNPSALLPKRVLGETALFTPQGLPLALGAGWERSPPAYVLRSEQGASLRHIVYGEIDRIVALAPVPGWPLTAGTSVRSAEALGTWYGSLPLYLFVILGPAIVGAALAVILVGTFERADRARAALVALKAIGEKRAGSESTPTSRDPIRR
jgi:hypothetical protein